MATTSENIFPLFYILVSLTFFFPSSSSISERNNNDVGFSALLISHDSVESPFYRPNLTYAQRLQAAVERSVNRYHYLNSKSWKRISTKDFQSLVWPSDGEYVIRYYIGTPPVRTYGIIDTGSGLTWLQCLPCESCFNQSIPIFDPAKSSSYEPLPCNELDCDNVQGTCEKDDYNKMDFCKYEKGYVDDSYSMGYLAHETLMFMEFIGSWNVNLTFPEIVIGCGHENKENGNGVHTPGVIGLDRSKSSFLFQHGYKQFSYCFSPSEQDSWNLIRFGSVAQIQGSTTPLLTPPTNKTGYYLHLEGISVNDDCLPIPPGTFNITEDGEGGFVLDSGFQFTILNHTAFTIMTQAIANNFKDILVHDPDDKFDLCYVDETSLTIPPAVTFHFSGVDLKLDEVSTWINKGKGLHCLAIFPTAGALSVFGNRQQTNLNVGYDLENEIVSFQHKTCTRQ